MGTESALVVVVPEAESCVGRFRVRYDPAAAEGVPAHVTVLYPFLSPRSITPNVESALRQVFSALGPFETVFKEIRQFPGVLYLAPGTDALFRRLTAAVFARFPEAPPYQGKFADVVPHLTVAHAANATELTKIKSELEAVAKSALPITANVRDVALLEKRDGRWSERRRFWLGQRRTWPGVGETIFGRD